MFLTKVSPPGEKSTIFFFKVTPCRKQFRLFLLTDNEKKKNPVFIKLMQLLRYTRNLKHDFFPMFYNCYPLKRFRNTIFVCYMYKCIMTFVRYNNQNIGRERCLVFNE